VNAGTVAAVVLGVIVAVVLLRLLGVAL